MLRGTVSLPKGSGKTVRVVVFAPGDAARAAEEAGADLVGAEELVARVEGGFLDFDVAISTPDLMGQVGKLGRTLGPRGLMPNPKTGTVTTDVGKAVEEFKAGKVEYRTDKFGNVHVPVGKASFDQDALVENFLAGARRDQPGQARVGQGPVPQVDQRQLHDGPRGQDRPVPHPARRARTGWSEASPRRVESSVHHRICAADLRSPPPPGAAVMGPGPPDEATSRNTDGASLARGAPSSSFRGAHGQAREGGGRRGDPREARGLRCRRARRSTAG